MTGYYVLLRRSADGEERMFYDDVPWADYSHYLWTEGNFSCDCNRAMFFNGETVEADRPCGDEAYTAVKAILPDGMEIRLDEES